MADTVDPREWRPDTYRQLHELICVAVRGEGEKDKELDEQLRKLAPGLKALLQDPPKSAAHRSDVEKGRLWVGG
jgi:hypothetical protein